MKLLLVLFAVLYVCYGTTISTTTTTKPESTLKPEDPAITQDEEKSELHDGIDLNTLTNEEIEQLANAEDEEFLGELGKLRLFSTKIGQRKLFIYLLDDELKSSINGFNHSEDVMLRSQIVLKSVIEPIYDHRNRGVGVVCAYNISFSKIMIC